MHGTCTWPDRVAGQTEVMFHTDFRRHADLLRACAQQFCQTAAAMEQATPTSP
jgi:hypothetical protein